MLMNLDYCNFNGKVKIYISSIMISLLNAHSFHKNAYAKMQGAAGIVILISDFDDCSAFSTIHA